MDRRHDPQLMKTIVALDDYATKVGPQPTLTPAEHDALQEAVRLIAYGHEAHTPTSTVRMLVLATYRLTRNTQ